MGRIIGLIGCSILVITALRLTNLQHVDTATLKGSEVRPGAKAKLTPRDNYKRGKEMFLRGKYLQSLPLLEEATMSSTGLTSSERRQADDYLNQARAKVQAVAENDDRLISARRKPVVRGQSGAWDDPTLVADETPAEDVRERVGQLMNQSRQSLKNGKRADAIRYAQLARNLANENKLKFAKSEVSPGEFLAKLTSMKSDTQDRWADGNDKSMSGVTQAVAKSTTRSAVQQISAGDGSDALTEVPETAAKVANSAKPAATNRRSHSSKERATTLLAQARDDIQAGRYDEAKRKALEADQLDASYDMLNDDTPDLVLAVIDRQFKSTTIARNSGSKSVNQAGVRTRTGSGAETGLEQTSSTEETAEARKQRALKLLGQARADMKSGDLDSAQSKAEQAQDLNVSYSLFDDLPDNLLNDISDRRKSGTIARNGGKAASDSDAGSQEKMRQAKSMLAKAKRALKEGRIDDARDLTNKVARMKLAFGLFDENPETLLSEIDRAAKGKNGNSTSEGAEADGLVKQAEALALLSDARKLMKEGRHQEARLKVLQVEEMDVALPTTADSPDLVLADLKKSLGNSNMAARKGRASTDVNTANAVEADSDNPFSPRGNRENKLVGVSGTQEVDGDDVPAIGRMGLSASELYSRGMAELKKGKRDIAWQAFKAAHDSGERLDPVRTQRMNDYLRDLAPRGNHNKIRQANREEESVVEATPLDIAQQEQLVKFERIRSEVLNSVFKAEHLKDTEPEKALELIDQTMAKVESAELSTEAAAPLMKQLNRTRSVMRTEIEQQAPNIELRAQNKHVKDQIEKDIKNAVRIDQDMVKLVEEYNDLYKQQRFAEAVVVAKKAKELNPKDPTVVMMVEKGKIALQNNFNDTLKSDKEKSRLQTINDLERGLVHDHTDNNPMTFDGKIWDKAKGRKDKYGADNRVRSEDEIQIEKSLQKRISLHEDNVPLVEVIRKIKAVADINIWIDDAGLEEEGVSSNTAVSIDVDSISVKSALNLILGRFQLGYMIDNEVLKITNQVRQRGELTPRTYSVADLVVPIPDFTPEAQSSGSNGMSGFGNQGFGNTAFNNSGLGGQAFGQVGPNGAAAHGMAQSDMRLNGPARHADFNELTNLITSTIAPDTWQQAGGQADVQHFDMTLSLVIRQTQKVHEEIADLLAQLRRLQDLQVTIEVRFVTVSDRFFERIGIDFDFNIKPSVGYPKVDNTLLPLSPFGTVQIPQSGLSSINQQGQQGQGGQQGGGQQGGQQGQQGGQQGQQGQNTASGLFQTGPIQNLYNSPKSNTVVGLRQPNQFTNDLTIPFNQGSFDVGVPTFGGYNPAAGVQTGLAILSDLEAFFFIQAAQGDSRTNLLFAPKVTTFNGVAATVSDTKNRPFVTGLTPTVGFASVGYTPTITTIREGIVLNVIPVVSADRRFVRLSLAPSFTSITDVFTFSAVGGGGGGGGQGGQQGQGGGGQQGGQGGFGGGGGGQGGGGGGGGGGQFGIGGGLGSMQIMDSLFTQGFGGGGGGGQQGGGQQGGGQQGGGQQGQGGQQGGGQAITVQQPVIETVTVATTVSVPDGGSVLLGGIKRLREGRNMSGVPILNKIPYVSRLFKNSGVGRETESLMLMVTPRIIIQEEEEELLGVPRN